MTTKPFILIDCSSYLYRAFYALPPLTNSKGQQTGAIYGVINMVRRLLKDYQPDHIAIVFDAPGKTFRDELFEQYKATRQETPPEIFSQFPYLKKILEFMGLPVLQIEGVEADDVIATLALMAKNQGFPVLISTGDKDIAQIVDDQITLINTMTNTILNRQGVINKFGLPPERIVDYLALIGDSVDNIPGIPKVGPKTAVKWLQDFGTLDGVIANAAQIKGVVGENLRNNLSTLQLSRLLATIKTDVALDITMLDLSPGESNQEALLELFKELEFKSWLKEAQNLNPSPTSPNNSAVPMFNHYQMIQTEAAFEKWLNNITQAAFCAFDCETTSLNTLDAEIVGLSFAITKNEACYIPLAHNTSEAQLNREVVLKKLKPIFENEHIKKIAHNFKYDLSVLSNYDIHIDGLYADSMLESYVLNSASSRHDMDTLAAKFLDYQTIKYEEVAGKGAKHIGFANVAIDVATRYAAEDADICLQLHESFYPKIEAEPAIYSVFHEIEMPLIPVLARIERIGVLVDTEKLLKQSERLTIRIDELTEQIYDLAGSAFNINSPKQLQEILFQNLKLPILEKTPTGQPSTAENVLQELAVDFPLPKLILEHRSLSKLKSTYTDALPKQIHPKTGRIHTSYNQAVTATGRLSSTEPNLQNIPVRTEEGRQIRQAFIAPPGYRIISCDYSQIELRIMAHLSDDEGLLNAFAQGKDIHRATAAEIFNVGVDDVTDLQRRSAKAINFGLIYGMSAFGLSKQLNIETNQAKAYIERYFQRYPGVKTYMENTRKLAHANGYVETIFGRRLYLPDIQTRNQIRVKAAERAAINAPMQGTAADIIKKAMIAVDHELKNSPLARMVLQVHDELVFEIEENYIDTIVPKILELMSGTAQLKVPLIVDWGVGFNWDEAH